MQLQVTCSNCYQRTRARQEAIDRSEFAKKYGKTVKVTCSKCGKLDTYHVNDIKAVNKITRPLSAIVLLVSTGLVVYLLRSFFFESFGVYQALAVFGILIVPSWFYMLINKEAIVATSRFNKYYV